MAPQPPRFDPWPFLPRGPADGARRPEGDHADAAVTTAVGLAAILLLLRHLLPDGALATEFAALTANIGLKGGFAVTVALIALLFSAALVSPLPLPPGLRQAALGAFDRGLHLALVLTVGGILSVIVLHGEISRIALTFTLLALALMAGYRVRFHLAQRSAA